MTIPKIRKPAKSDSHLSDVNIPSTAKNPAIRKATQYNDLINIFLSPLLKKVFFISGRYYLTPENKDQLLFLQIFDPF